MTLRDLLTVNVSKMKAKRVLDWTDLELAYSRWTRENGETPHEAHKRDQAAKRMGGVNRFYLPW